jgi:hypothetical protein
MSERRYGGRLGQFIGGRIYGGQVGADEKKARGCDAQNPSQAPYPTQRTTLSTFAQTLHRGQSPIRCSAGRGLRDRRARALRDPDQAQPSGPPKLVSTELRD